jgi:hypothetical protein
MIRRLLILLILSSPASLFGSGVVRISQPGCFPGARKVAVFLSDRDEFAEKSQTMASLSGEAVFNFTLGIRMNADYTTPDMSNYLSSDAIMENLKKFEKIDSHGLNSCIVLIHLGTSAKRTDKF